MEFEVTISEDDLKALVLGYLQRNFTEISLELGDVKIEVKSKQNFRSEWEEASFRARVVKREKVEG